MKFSLVIVLFLDIASFINMCYVYIVNSRFILRMLFSTIIFLYSSTLALTHYSTHKSDKSLSSYMSIFTIIGLSAISTFIHFLCGISLNRKLLSTLHLMYTIVYPFATVYCYYSITLDFIKL